MLKTGFYRPPTTGSTEYSDAPYRTRSVQVIFLASRAHVIVGRVLLRPKKGEAIASVLFAFTATGLIALLYNLNPFNSWMLLIGVWASSEALIRFLLHKRKNEKESQKHTVS